MPKIKTRRSAKKRYRLTATGKVRFKKMGLRHILTKKSSKRKRQLRRPGTLSATVQKTARTLLPYG